MLVFRCVYISARAEVVATSPSIGVVCIRFSALSAATLIALTRLTCACVRGCVYGVLHFRQPTIVTLRLVLVQSDFLADLNVNFAADSCSLPARSLAFSRATTNSAGQSVCRRYCPGAVIVYGQKTARLSAYESDALLKIIL